MELQGKLLVKNETQTFGANGFRKRECVIETVDSQYPQKILIEFVQDKCDLLNSFNIGQEVKIALNINGREWTNPQGEVKYFNSIQGWRIESVAAAPNQGAPLPPADAFEPVNNVNTDDHDDLPF